MLSAKGKEQLFRLLDTYPDVAPRLIDAVDNHKLVAAPYWEGDCGCVIGHTLVHISGEYVDFPTLSEKQLILLKAIFNRMMGDSKSRLGESNLEIDLFDCHGDYTPIKLAVIEWMELNSRTEATPSEIPATV